MADSQPQDLRGPMLLSQADAPLATAGEVALRIASGWDAAVVAPSWDERCLTICRAGLSPPDTVFRLRFQNTGDTGRQSEHAAELDAWLDDAGVRPTDLTVASEDVESGWEHLRAGILSLRAKIGRPLRLLIDLSTTPRVLSLGIIGELAREGAVDAATYCYAEAVYDERDLEEQTSVFTSGRWRSIAIPGLMGEYTPARGRAFLVSLGFDGDDTFRFINAVEPDRVGTIIGDPPVREGLVEDVLDRNSFLLDDWVYEENRWRLGAVDAAGVAALVMALRKKWSDANLHVLCVGPKPHALGMALAALAEPEIAVVHRVPQRYRETATTLSTTTHWYHVRRRSSVSAHLPVVGTNGSGQ